jgi:hypothetical protein
MSEKTTDITVKYTGKADFQETAQDEATFHHVKLKALHHFGIEHSASSKYVLQYEGVDLADDKHVSTLHQHTLVLVLTLNHEPPKG